MGMDFRGWRWRQVWKVSCFWFDSGRNTPSDNFVVNQPLPPLPSEDLHLTGERLFLLWASWNAITFRHESFCLFLLMTNRARIRSQTKITINKIDLRNLRTWRITMSLNNVAIFLWIDLYCLLEATFFKYLSNPYNCLQPSLNYWPSTDIFVDGCRSAF